MLLWRFLLDSPLLLSVLDVPNFEARSLPRTVVWSPLWLVRQFIAVTLLGGGAGALKVWVAGVLILALLIADPLPILGFVPWHAALV